MRQFVPCLVLVTLAATPCFAQTPRASTPAPTTPFVVTYGDRQAIEEQTPSPATAATPTVPSAQAPTTPPGRGMAPAAPVATTVPAMAAPSYPLPSLPVNVRLDLAITDTYGGTPSKKVVTLLVANGGSGMVRTANRLSDNSPVNLNVDTNVRVYPNGVVMLMLTFQYTPAQSPEANRKEGLAYTPRPADLNESVNVILQDGKPTIVSQSADPATDRKVTAEVTATIVK